MQFMTTSEDAIYDNIRKCNPNRRTRQSWCNLSTWERNCFAQFLWNPSHCTLQLISFTFPTVLSPAPIQGVKIICGTHPGWKLSPATQGWKLSNRSERPLSARALYYLCPLTTFCLVSQISSGSAKCSSSLLLSYIVVIYRHILVPEVSEL